MKEPLVSVIILNYNGLNDIEECFNSLYKLNYKKIEFILVDNNSQDGSVEFVKKKYKRVKIVDLDKNYGFAQGNNIGVKYSNGEYVVLLNQDTVVDENWLSELVKVAQKSENYGIVGGKILYYDDKKSVNFGGSYFDKYGNLMNIRSPNRINKSPTEMKAFYISGASLLFKKHIVKNIGLFDPIYFMYYEDVDFCWRTWIFGYDVMYTPKSIIFHKIDRENRNFKRKKYFTDRNQLRTLLKNYEIRSLFKILPGYFYQRLVSIFKSKIYYQQKPSILIIIYLKSFFWNLLHIKSLIENRKKVQNFRKRSDNFLFQVMHEIQYSVKKMIPVKTS